MLLQSQARRWNGVPISVSPLAGELVLLVVMGARGDSVPLEGCSFLKYQHLSCDLR